MYMIQIRWSFYKCRILGQKLSRWVMKCLKTGIMIRYQIFQYLNLQIIYKTYKIFQMFLYKVTKIANLQYRGSKCHSSSQKIIEYKISQQKWNPNNQFNSILNKHNNINFLYLINNNSQCKISLEWIIKWINL